jgi:Uma2 family endonuclease
MKLREDKDIAMNTGPQVTTAIYDRMLMDGVFEQIENGRFELFRGKIHQLHTVSPGHEHVQDELLEWSASHCDKQAMRFRVRLSLPIPELDSVPLVDIAWVRRQNFVKTRPTTADVSLLIEIAEDSLQFDQNEKSRLYAEAGVHDYWIANVKAEAIEVHRNPVDGAYTDVQSFKDNQELSPLVLPAAKLTAAQIWTNLP